MQAPFEIVLTGDGSHSLSLPDGKVSYHSRHGAAQESRHVFLETGLLPALEKFPDGQLNIFEMGFGTGLNALLTAITASETQRNIRYHTIDLYPLPPATQRQLNYGALLRKEAIWQGIGAAFWDQWTDISPYFSLKKEQADLLTLNFDEKYHLIYFDAFAPQENPDLWSEAVFTLLRKHTVPGGILVTYCSKSSVRKAMQNAGWQVAKLPGPPGKREIVRAVAGIR